jgi:hypothetical protein
LEDLAVPFTTEEMDKVVKVMPVDKAPGPDGFNGLFMKKCWHIIKHDFYNLAMEFCKGTINLEHINTSYISLIPKKQSAESINDYRPISLTNCCLKFLTKMAADRFQKVIMQCIHKNQYGFIKSRTIHDCLAWTFEYIHQCKASKKPVVILKLDFEKAFDTIEHEVIYEILRKKGFSKEWIAWVKMILESGISSVLINGVPCKQFKCKRGVRQGDPLSPLLFVLGADLLQSVVTDLLQRGLISLPIHTGDPDFPIIQYADDTLLIVPADSVQLSVLKEALQDFSSSTGLKVNFHKSCMLPLNLSDEEVAVLARDFGCEVGVMPFTYLGLPLGTTRPSMQDLLPMVDRMERRLTASSSLLA